MKKKEFNELKYEIIQEIADVLGKSKNAELPLITKNVFYMILELQNEIEVQGGKLKKLETYLYKIKKTFTGSDSATKNKLP